MTLLLYMYYYLNMFGFIAIIIVVETQTVPSLASENHVGTGILSFYMTLRSL